MHRRFQLWKTYLRFTTIAFNLRYFFQEATAFLHVYNFFLFSCFVSQHEPYFNVLHCVFPSDTNLSTRQAFCDYLAWHYMRKSFYSILCVSVVMLKNANILRQLVLICTKEYIRIIWYKYIKNSALIKF